MTRVATNVVFGTRRIGRDGTLDATESRHLAPNCPPALSSVPLPATSPKSDPRRAVRAGLLSLD
jgi:hypothetical protein